MKKFIKKLSLLKIVTMILVVAILVSIISFLPQLQLKYSDVAGIVQEGIQKGDFPKIDKAIKSNVLVAQNGGRSLYVNPNTLNVTVVDDATGTVWTSIPQTGTLEDEDKAPMLVSFLDATGAVNNWDTYTQCISLDNTTRELEVGEDRADTYTVYQLPDGFRAKLNVTKAEVTDLNQYMPKKISIDRYNECFIAKIDEFKAGAVATIKDITGVELKADESGNYDANIDAEILEALDADELKKVTSAQTTLEDAVKYVKALDMIYDIDAETEDHYYNKYAGTPPLTVTNILIDLSKKALYTREDLINDSREFDITDVEFAQPADFTIIMDVKLVDGDLVVHIPTYEIKNNSEDPDYYTLHSISVFPNFGIVNADSYDEGFIFVPDGSGALFDINSYDSGYAEYERPIYNNTYFDTLYTDSEYNEDLMLPVFGMGKNGKTAVPVAAAEETAEEAVEEPAEDATAVVEEEEDALTVVDISTTEDKNTGVYTGFMGIIESGAETAALTVKLGSKAQDASSLNKVYPTFDVMQYSNVKVFGPYSTNEAKFLAKTGSFGMDIKVRYKLYTENCNYYTMAADYKEYLLQTNENIKVEYDVETPAPEVYLDVISALTVEDRIMGIPYDNTISMTTYSELNDILNDLGKVDTVVSYKGAYNGGIYNKVNQKADKTKANGSEDEYKKLMENHGDSIYMSTPISYVYKDDAVFNPERHALLGFDSEPVKVYDYDIPTGRFNLHGEGHWILSPYYLPGVVETFKKSLEDNTNLALEDLGNLVYAHNKPEEEVNLYEGELVVKKALDKLSEGDRKLILTNPFATRMLYAEYSTDISRESSDYGLIRHNVPFRQLVMNGLTKYTTLTINESSSGKAYYLLQAIELGSSPKYKITAKSVDDLKEGNYHELFSTEYSLIAADIKAMAKEIDAAFAQIGTNEITGHRLIDEKVYETTYATGVKVVVNYNKLDVTTEYGDIPAEGYIIIAAEEAPDAVVEENVEGGEVDG
ncbi:MAG: hypothetical protein IJ316_04995 [Clostridia bacterium]|nr:hypothetical protein [Clostridia bacterium]